MTKYRMHILVCGGTGCRASESDVIIDKFKELLSEYNYDKEVQVVQTGCFGFCEQGPIVKIHPDNVFYVRVKPEDVREIVEEHIIKGRRVSRLLFVDPTENEKVEESRKMGFYKKQLRIALRNCGLI